MSNKDVLNRILAAMRLACLAACILALLDIGLPVPSRRRVSYLLFDTSDSVGRSGVEESRRSALELVKGLQRSDRIGIIAFAKKPRLISRPMGQKDIAEALEECELESEESGNTDVSLALSFAADLLRPEKGEKAVLLFGDGRATSGATAAPERLARQGLKVFAYPVGNSSGGVVSRSLDPPEAPRAGERVKLQWRIFADEDAEIRYSVKVDGVTEYNASARLEKGENALDVAVDAGQAGERAVEIEARDGKDEPLPLASCGALIRVGGERKVLAVHGGKTASPVSSALRLQGIQAVDAAVDSLPETAPGYSGFTAVVLDDVSALSLTESRQKALVDFVSGGGGLLVFGGYSSLGRGEYYSSMLEDVLPVETDTRQRLFFSRAKILFVVDHSGSMSDMAGGVSKQMAAMRGVAASIPELNPQDEVGVMSFDSMPTWILPFTPASKVEEIREAISAMPEGGGTDMSKAIEEIIRGFGAVGPNKRHAVILTDGLTQEADFKGLSSRLKLNGISVSTVGIGEEVNETLLRDLAEWNDGVYHRANLDEIPKIIKKETIRVTRDLIQEGRFFAKQGDPSSMLSGVEADLPRYSGYLITKPKPLASVLLETPGSDDSNQNDPLMATWRYGNGSVCVFTSDSGGNWLSAWAGSPAYKRLWAQTIRAIERPGRDEGLRARASLSAGRARLIVEAQDAEGRASSGRSLSARDAAGKGVSARLVETAPGHYEAQLELEGGGLRVFQIADALDRSWTQAWLWNPGGAEMTSPGPDIAFLSDLAQANRGALISRESLVLPKPSLAWLFLSVRVHLIVFALILLIMELYCRSALFGQLSMAKATLTAWLKGQATLVEEIERRGDKGQPGSAPWSPDDSKKAMNAYRRLAERYRDLAAKREQPPQDDPGSEGQGKSA